MGQNEGEQLKMVIIEIVENHEPAVTVSDVVERVDAEKHDVVKAIEELQQAGEIKDDIVLWRGANRTYSSGTS